MRLRWDRWFHHTQLQHTCGKCVKCSSRKASTGGKQGRRASVAGVGVVWPEVRPKIAMRGHRTLCYLYVRRQLHWQLRW